MPLNKTEKTLKGLKKERDRVQKNVFSFMGQALKTPNPCLHRVESPSDRVNDVTPFFHKHGEIKKKTVGGGFNVTNVLKQASSGLSPPCRSHGQLAGDV